MTPSHVEYSSALLPTPSRRTGIVTSLELDFGGFVGFVFHTNGTGGVKNEYPCCQRCCAQPEISVSTFTAFSWGNAASASAVEKLKLGVQKSDGHGESHTAAYRIVSNFRFFISGDLGRMNVPLRSNDEGDGGTTSIALLDKS